MKKIILLGALITIPVHAADFVRRTWQWVTGDTYTVGYIDRLVLKKAVAEKGLEALKKEVNDHQFTQTIILESLPERYEQEPNPYVIKQVVNKSDSGDSSELAQAVFDRLYKMYVQEVAFPFPGNSLNAKSQTGNFKSSNRIDYCTSAQTLDDSCLGSVDTVKVNTKFYDKYSLLGALK